MVSRSDRKEQRRQRNVRAMGIFIVAIMVFSTFAFVLIYYAPVDQPQQQQLSVEDGRVVGTFDGEKRYFYSYPDHTIPVPPEAVSLLSGPDAIVVLFDPSVEENLPYIDRVRWDLTQHFDIQQGAAVTEPSDSYPFSVSSCSEATAQSPFIKIINGTRDISVNASCITISGYQEDFLILFDQLLYSHYGVR